MPTKKSAKSTKSQTAKKAAPKKAATKTTVHTVSSSKPKTTSASVAANATRNSTKQTRWSIGNNTINIVLAELVGTFILTLVALLTASDVLPLLIGLTFAVIVMMVGIVSGAHVNPAVTFGLWAARKLRTVLVPFYWVAQLLGAMAAVVVLNAVAGTKLNLSFAHFNEFSWPIFWIELIGTGIFLFGFTTVLRHRELSATGKALGLGLALFVGLAVSSALYTPTRTAAINSIQNSDKARTQQITAEDLPHSILVSGATLNPAIALGSTETPASSLLSGSADNSGSTHYSRLGWEVILGTFIGAAAGANLTYVIDRRFKDAK